MAGKGLVRDNAMQIKVLHVEDDSSFALVSKKILESENNFHIEIASSVKEAYEKLKENMFDVIVSDFDLPLKDGLSFLEELVKTEKQPPFILFTGKGREEIAIKALNLGANGYVNKHGNPQTVYGELAHSIIQVVETKRKEKNLLESENKFRTVADYMYDWEYWTSPEAKLLFVSPSSKRLTGYTAEEFIANPKLLFNIVHPDDKPSLTNHFSVITQEPTHIRDFRIITKNGETRWLSHACQPVFDEKGKFLGRRISNRDITDRKQAEKNLALSEKKWEATLASIGDAVIATDTSAKITFMNKTAEDATGWSIQQAVNRPLGEVFNIINEETRSAVESPVKKVLEKGVIVGLANHTMLVRKDGTTLPIDDSGAPIKDKKDVITGAVLVFRDITERKKAEEALVKSEKRWEATLSSIGDSVIATDTEAKITFMNQAAQDCTGWSLTDALGKPLSKVFHIINENTRKPVENPVTKVLEKGMVVGLANHTLLIRRDGTEIPIDDSGAPITEKSGKIFGVVLVFQDISERKKAERALEASEKRYRQLFTSMTEQFQLFELVFDQSGKPVDYRILDVNPAFERLVGKSREQLIGKQVVKELWPVEQYWLDAFYQVYKTGKSKRYENFGNAFGRHYDLHIYRINQNQLATIATDITERKKAEKEIADLARFPSENPNPVLRISQEGKLLFHNNAANVLIEQSGEKTVLAAIVEHATTVLKTKRKKEFELEVGKQVFLFTFTPILKSGYTNVYGLDITEKKKMEIKLAKYSKDLENLVKERSSQLNVAEQQLIKAERLAAIGELAGMIGHDLRNPLTGIKTSIYYLKKNNLQAMEPKSKAMIEVVEKCIDHSNKIINDLLEYSKEIKLEPQLGTPETLISETIAMLKTPSAVTIINQVTTQTSLHVDFDKMKRVFSNLIKNSIEAMPNGGSITITCKQAKDAFEFCIADTGPGIPPQVMTKIFTPLVTTKAQGMGFGLAICKRIVEAHDGTISVETCAKGTSFTVKVPTKR